MKTQTPQKVMFKYLLLALIGYYVYISFLGPKLNAAKKEHQHPNELDSEDEYVDYEEIK